jgi:FlaA1/EpsC-like NDP-sugar epimerase
MFKVNGFRSSAGWLFAMMDSLLILTGIFLGIYFRFWEMIGLFRPKASLVLRVTVVVLVIQLGFYYFDLYHSRIIRGSKKMGILLAGALAVSFIVLTIIYYMIPSLTIGRGVLAISLFLIFTLTFLWRIVYSHVLKAWSSKERILIIGTGELAKQIKGEILDNGYEGFEIVGFIDENRDKIGNKL